MISTVFRIYYFHQLSKVCGINYVRRTELYTTKLLVPDPCLLEFEIGIEKLKRCKLPGIVQIPAELIQAGGTGIPIAFGVAIKLVWVVKMCLSESHNKVHIGNHLSDSFPIQSCLKQGGVGIEHNTSVHSLC